MNKTALKNFAVSARRELIERVELQALKIGISKEKIEEADIESSDAFVIEGHTLTDIERRQRNQLINRIEDRGYDQVIEEVAYTWFNRFVALRYMEVNDYLPTRVRVFSSESGTSTEPDMIKEALTLDLEIDKEKIYDWKMNNKTDELFKYLIQLHCNDLNKYMPFMFETLEDYKMILFPEGLLGTESFVMDMINTENIPEENWEQVEIIGWLYQFYIAEEKNRVLKLKKYKSPDIPFATQLFTPEWIVKYMVQNSLGKYWVESHPEDEELIESWDYYLENTDEKYRDMKQELVNSDLNVEEIKCFDPAMGSGHILVYMFDLLYEIYSKRGYMSREIPKLIIENNLYGLDIDERAYQLAGFSIIMKALEYNRRFLRTIERDGLKLNLAAIEESNTLTDKHIEYLNLNDEESAKQYIEQFKHAKSIGSLLKLENFNTEKIEHRIEELSKTPVTSIFDKDIHEQILTYIPRILNQTNIMTGKYDIIVTNPPYMGSNKMNEELTTYLDKYYPDSKADLFAAFMELEQYTKENGFYSLINQHHWMFISSYEKLRINLIENKNIDTMLHLGVRAFEEVSGEVVQSTAFVMRNKKLESNKGMYIRLVDYKNAQKKEEKALSAIQGIESSNYYQKNQKNFNKIPGKQITYWALDSILLLFNEYPFISDISYSRLGMATASNKNFLRHWFEIDFNKIGINYGTRESAKESEKRWFPYNKGGEYRRWYGNNYYVVDWEMDGSRIRNFKNERGKIRSHNYNLDFIFKPGLTWSALSTGKFSLRYFPEGFLFDNSGSSLFAKNSNNIELLLGFLNTNIAQEIFSYLNPTLNYQPGTVGSLPINLNISEEKRQKIKCIVNSSISIAKGNWDTFEVSWDFINHPFIEYKDHTIELSFINWKKNAESRYNQLKKNEEELNQLFIETYDLENEFKSEIEYKDVSISKADLERDTKSFISYAVGCALGRYSLDEEGLIYAGGEFDPSRYQTFPADENNILPILPNAYFEDDIVSLFIKFVETVYGTETLEENLTFVAEAIGKRKNESVREGIRRYFLNNFYKDHVNTFKTSSGKTPIYWQITSGKEKAFNCLIYMHRYDKTTLSRIRTEYLHDVQARYDTVKSDLQYVIDSDANASEIRNAKKELTSVDKKIIELKEFDEKLHHMADMQIEIDLDDGVKENYKQFKGLLTKI